MQIGAGWTNKDNDGKVTGIYFALDEAVTEIFPQLKRVKIVAKPIPGEQRKSEKSPGCPAALLQGSGCGTVKDPQRYSRLLKEHR